MIDALSNTSSRLNPVFRLRQIFEEVEAYLSNVFGTEKTDITITLIYKKQKDSAWDVLVQRNPSDNEIDIK